MAEQDELLSSLRALPRLEPSEAERELPPAASRSTQKTEDRTEAQQANVQRSAEAWLAEQRHRTSLQLDFAGWNSHADVAVWTLGYYASGKFQVVSGLSKSALSNYWFPTLHRQGSATFITRDLLGRWVQVLPGAY